MYSFAPLFYCADQESDGSSAFPVVDRTFADRLPSPYIYYKTIFHRAPYQNSHFASWKSQRRHGAYKQIVHAPCIKDYESGWGQLGWHSVLGSTAEAPTSFLRPAFAASFLFSLSFYNPAMGLFPLRSMNHDRACFSRIPSASLVGKSIVFSESAIAQPLPGQPPRKCGAHLSTLYHREADQATLMQSR